MDVSAVRRARALSVPGKVGGPLPCSGPWGAPAVVRSFLHNSNRHKQQSAPAHRGCQHFFLPERRPAFLMRQAYFLLPAPLDTDNGMNHSVSDSAYRCARSNRGTLSAERTPSRGITADTPPQENRARLYRAVYPMLALTFSPASLSDSSRPGISSGSKRKAGPEMLRAPTTVPWWL